MFYQLISLVGAALCLGAFIGNQRGWLHREMRLYNAMNFFGGLLLAWVAIVDRRAGFIILEVTWALVALPGMIRPTRAEAPPPGTPAPHD